MTYLVLSQASAAARCFVSLVFVTCGSWRIGWCRSGHRTWMYAAREELGSCSLSAVPNTSGKYQASWSSLWIWMSGKYQEGNKGMESHYSSMFGELFWTFLGDFYSCQ